MRAWLIIALLMVSPAKAIEPGERMSDPVLEERARTISRELRCMVCQNEAIDASNAGFAKDLRRLVRERIAAGDTDEQVLAYVTNRYGEFVRFRPQFGLHTLLLWAVPLIAVLFFGLLVLRRRSGSELSEDEVAEIERQPADYESARTTK